MKETSQNENLIQPDYPRVSAQAQTAVGGINSAQAEQEFRGRYSFFTKLSEAEFMQ